MLFWNSIKDCKIPTKSPLHSTSGCTSKLPSENCFMERSISSTYVPRIWMDLRMLCASLPISSSEWYSSWLCRFPSVSFFATSSIACNGSRMVSSTILLTFFAIAHARSRKIMITAIPATAQKIVLWTALLLCLSVNASNFFETSTKLFNAGVHLFKISSTACSPLPALISSMISYPIVSQSVSAPLYSV